MSFYIEEFVRDSDALSRIKLEPWLFALSTEHCLPGTEGWGYWTLPTKGDRKTAEHEFPGSITPKTHIHQNCAAFLQGPRTHMLYVLPAYIATYFCVALTSQSHLAALGLHHAALQQSASQRGVTSLDHHHRATLQPSRFHVRRVASGREFPNFVPTPNSILECTELDNRRISWTVPCFGVWSWGCLWGFPERAEELGEGQRWPSHVGAPLSLKAIWLFSTEDDSWTQQKSYEYYLKFIPKFEIWDFSSNKLVRPKRAFGTVTPSAIAVRCTDGIHAVPSKNDST